MFHVSYRHIGPITVIKMSDVCLQPRSELGVLTRFIIEALDEEMVDNSTTYTEVLRASLLIKDKRGRFDSRLGRELLYARECVVKLLKECATQDDDLQFFSSERGDFLIKIIPHTEQP